MGEFLADLTLYQSVFFVISMTSTLILLIQTALAIFGIAGGEADGDFDAGGLDADFDGDIDIDIDIEAADGSIGEKAAGAANDSGLKLFTVKGIMSFFMLGGWVGFLLLRANVHYFIATVLAVESGVLALVVMARFMRGLMGLQQDGTLKMKNALGQTGQVYIRIPASEQGKGKVSVTIQERFCEFDAVTEHDEMIKTGEKVYVTDVRPGNILVVERVKEN
ncbi:MAG: NfeD family protein [Oscillospiraceae bacterium]|nr:NfeD family protein [Oscillospiraceae bacterium]